MIANLPDMNPAGDNRRHPSGMLRGDEMMEKNEGQEVDGSGGARVDQPVRPRIGDYVRKADRTGVVDDVMVSGSKLIILWDDDDDSLEDPESLEIVRFGPRWLKKELKSMGIKR
jgi:hypothetical protein